jgi:hypothetical protein
MAFPQVWMGHDGYGRHEGRLDRLDFGIRYDAWLIPAFTKDTHQATCPAHFDIAALLDGMLQEQVTRKQGHGDEMSLRRPLRPHVNLG